MIRGEKGLASGVKCSDLFSLRNYQKREELAAEIAFDREVRAAIVVEMHSKRDSSLWAFNLAVPFGPLW